MRRPILLLAMFILSGACKKSEGFPEPPLDLGKKTVYAPDSIAPGVVCGTIYLADAHTAFTDLIFYKKVWYATFRHGYAHTVIDNNPSTYGTIKILKSDDGITWEVIKIIKGEADLRDPKFFIDEDEDKLIVSFFSVNSEGKETIFTNKAVSVERGDEALVSVEDSISAGKVVLWNRIALGRKRIFATGYVAGKSEPRSFFFKSDNSYKFKTSSIIPAGKFPSEVAVDVDSKSNLFLLVRNENEFADIIEASASNFGRFNRKFSIPITSLGGPMLKVYLDKYFIVSGRNGLSGRTSLWIYDIASGKMVKELLLPGDHETGYPGMAFESKGELWVTYYNINEGQGRKGNIYLVKINLDRFIKGET